MNDKELSKLIQNLDFDLIENEIEELSNNIEIDMEAVSAKAHKKLEKENLKMKRLKFKPIIAAALVAALSASVVYANEISDFVKSFMNKREIYSTVVDGKSYFLKDPIQLDENKSIESVVFTNKELTMMINTNLNKVSEGLPEYEISIVAGQKEYAPGGWGGGSNNTMITLYNETDNNYEFFPQSPITLNMGEDSYTIDLTEGLPVTASGEIKQAVQGKSVDNFTDHIPIGHTPTDDIPIDVDWINVGVKETDNGVRIITSFDDEELRLEAIGVPVEKTVNFMDDFAKWIGSTTNSMTGNLMGYGNDGNIYEYERDKNAQGFPVTVYESDVPKDVLVELKIPSLVVRYDLRKEFSGIDFEIPALDQEVVVNKEIDFNIQKIVLKSVRRTSETTAELIFDLNTGDKKEALFRKATMHSDDLKKVEGYWEDNIGKMTITFDERLKKMQMSMNNPSFVINGNWSVSLN